MVSIPLPKECKKSTRTCKVEHRVLKHTCMSVGENKSVSVEPPGILSVILHDMAKQTMGHRRTTDGSPRVSAFRHLRRIRKLNSQTVRMQNTLVNSRTKAQHDDHAFTFK